STNELDRRTGGATGTRGQRAPIHHWITSSARSSSDCGIVRPSVFAVLRLMMSSNFVGCSMGRSPGFAPLRILSTYTAAWRNISGEFTPYDMRPPAGTYSLFPNIVGSRLLVAVHSPDFGVEEHFDVRGLLDAPRQVGGH